MTHAIVEAVVRALFDTMDGWLECDHFAIIGSFSQGKVRDRERCTAAGQARGR